MSSQIERVIAVAAAELGTKESPPNSNGVKYNDWYYDRKVSGGAYPWCMAFVQWVFNAAGLSNLLYRTASCTALMNYAKPRGQFITSGFKRGDLVLFDFDGDRSKSEHVGIIKAVTGNSVVTIEGNTSLGNNADGGMVMERPRANGLIIGVYRPKYEEDEEVTQEQLNAMANKWWDTTNVFYKRLADVPTMWRSDTQELVKSGAIKGDGVNELGIRHETLRAAIINKRYADSVAMKK